MGQKKQEVGWTVGPASQVEVLARKGFVPDVIPCS